MKQLAPTFAPTKNTASKNTVKHANPVTPPNAPLGDGAMVQTGSSAWSGRVIYEEKHSGNTPQGSLTLLTKGGRVIFARDLEPVVTRLEPTPHGPRLVIESESFTATLPATPHILKLLARKLEATANA